MEFSLTAMGVVFLFLCAVGLLAFGGGCAIEAIKQYKLSRDTTFANACKHHQLLTIGDEIERLAYWFHGRDAAVVSAVGKSLKRGSLYFDAQYTRDHILPEVMKAMKAHLGDHWPAAEDCVPVYFVFHRDGPQSQFVEVENEAGKSLSVGKWVRQAGGAVKLLVHVAKVDVKKEGDE